MTATTQPQSTSTSDTDLPSDVGVLVIGSGFSGLAAAIKMAEQGRTDFVMIERGPDVGGTWRDTTYPGAACDVPSHLYSYSFELNPRWTRSFSRQGEIQTYLQGVARKHGVLDRHRFGTEVTSARWEEGTGTWDVQTTGGAYRARVVISAVGALCEPRLPDIPGLESFAGTVFHSARWDHDAELAGQRVAVVGTGASAIQIVPAIAEQVVHLDVYQRTAPWLLPRHDRPYTALERFAFRNVPGFQRLSRALIYGAREMQVLALAKNPKLTRVLQAVAEKKIRDEVADPALRAKVTPSWRIGCKRMLISNTWYPALQRANVHLVTDSIAEIRAEAVVTTDGTVREIDALVVATDFQVTDSPAHEVITGADGRTLARTWRESGMQAYKGTSVTGFPNMFFLVGPNTGLGHSSMVYMIESQVGYVVDALKTLDDRHLATVEVRREAMDDYNTELQRKLGRTVWTTGGCGSWYLDAHGNNTTLWPDFTFAFRRTTQHFDVDAYRISPRVSPLHHPRTSLRMSAATSTHFRGKVTVVTGAGSGIGRALAVDLAGRGARLALSDVDPAGLAETLHQAEALGAEVRSDHLDVGERGAVLAHADAVAEEFGGVNIVFNNAGISFSGEVEVSEFKDMERVTDVDYRGVVNGTTAFLPHLVASGDGHVVNTSSLFGLLAMPSQSAYNAAKFAVRGFTESLRQEMIIDERPVKVSCVHPGAIKTDVVRNGTAAVGTDNAAVAAFFDARLVRTTAAEAARVILRGVEKGHARILVGSDAKALDALVRITGSGYQRIITAVAPRVMPNRTPAL